LIVNKKGMENSEQMLEISNKSEKIPENSEIKREKKEEPTEIAEAESESEKQKTPVVAKAKGRGRPKGSVDAKPRIKRIPIAAPEEEEIPKPKVKVKKVIVQDEPEEQEEEQEVAAEITEPEPVVPKSPKTLRREHMQTVAQQKRAMAQARQDRFERVLDGFMGF